MTLSPPRIQFSGVVGLPSPTAHSDRPSAAPSAPTTGGAVGACGDRGTLGLLDVDFRLAANRGRPRAAPVPDDALLVNGGLDGAEVRERPNRPPPRKPHELRSPGKAIDRAPPRAGGPSTTSPWTAGAPAPVISRRYDARYRSSRRALPMTTSVLPSCTTTAGAIPATPQTVAIPRRPITPSEM